MTRHGSPRRGATIVEFAAGMVLITIAGYSLAQLGLHTASERLRVECRSDALEAAANILEAARALEPNQRTPEWAGRQALPEHLAGRLPEGKLTVQIREVQGFPRLQTVAVRVEWTNPGKIAARPVELTALFPTATGEKR